MITLEKAIELIELYLTHPIYKTDPDYYNSLKIAVEAMKDLVAIRHVLLGLAEPLLPGEARE